MAGLFDNISSYDNFISKLKFSIKTIETFKEKIDYKTVTHQTKVFIESLRRQGIIKSYVLLSDKTDICNLKNGILTIIKIKIDTEPNKKIKEESLKQLYNLYNLDYKYAKVTINSRIIEVGFDFDKWLLDSFKD